MALLQMYLVLLLFYYHIIIISNVISEWLTHLLPIAITSSCEPPLAIIECILLLIMACSKTSFVFIIYCANKNIVANYIYTV